MKILVIGAGVIGAVYGWALSEAGNDVTHLVRPGRAALYTSGMKMDILDKRKGHNQTIIGVYPIQVTENLHPSDGYDLVIVPTKHYDLINVLEQTVPVTEHADYLLLTQNWGGTDEIEKILPSSRFLFGDAGAGGAFKDGVLVAAISSAALGQIEGRQDPCLKRVEELFREADIKVSLRDNILHYIWAQYAVNAGWWPAIVKAGSISSVVRDKVFYREGLLAVRECLQVASRYGVDIHKHPEISMYLGDSRIKNVIMKLGIKYMTRYSEFFKRTSSHALGNPKEISVFYYDLLESGKALGLEMSALGSYKPEIEKLTVL